MNFKKVPGRQIRKGIEWNRPREVPEKKKKQIKFPRPHEQGKGKEDQGPISGPDRTRSLSARRRARIKARSAQARNQPPNTCS